MVSLISSQGYFTFLYKPTKHNIHNREGGGKENKQTQTWVGSKRTKREVYDPFLAFCASVSDRDRVFERNSHKVTRNADSSSHVGQPRLWFHRSEQSPFSPADWPVLLTAFFCFCFLLYIASPVFFRSRGKFRAQALCVGCAKTDKGVLWLAPTPTPTETNATHRITETIREKLNPFWEQHGTTP